MQVSHLPFVQPQKPFLLHAYLERFRGWRKGAVVLDRMNFGSSGHRAPPTALTISAYTDRDVPVMPAPVTGKVLVHFDALVQMRSAHDVDVLPGWDKVTADLDVYDDQTTRGNRWEPVRMNHYVARSYDECEAARATGRGPAGPAAAAARAAGPEPPASPAGAWRS